MLNDFIEYLQEQVGQPYLWGGQHTKLTPENYVSVINTKEHKDGKDLGKYSDGTTYANAAIAYCEKLFDKGAEVLYAYDCSGLGMYWLQNLEHIYKSDLNANSMMSKCELTDDLPKRGYWVFRVADDGRATHIGYMISDEYLVEAKGRKYGVSKTKFKAKDWSKWGIPECFREEIIMPEPEVELEPDIEETDPDEQIDEAEEEPKTYYVLVIAKSVRVHTKPKKTSKTLWIAHNEDWYAKHHHTERADMYKILDIADNGWYHVQVLGDPTHIGYITNKPKYVTVLGGGT